MQLQAHSDCLTTMAAATTLARAGVTFLVLLVVRNGGLAPLIEVGWLPAVVVVAIWWPGTRGRCWPRRQGTAG